MTVTARQKEVGALLAAGLTAEEVAAELNISTNTVMMHRSALYQSLGITGHVNPIVLLVHYALQHRWLENKYRRGPGRPRKSA